MTKDKNIVVDGRATAEDLAKQVENLLRENLVGFTKREGDTLTFTLAGGQSFSLVITEK